MEIVFVKKVVILSNTFKIVYDKLSDGGSFSFSEGVIKVGIKSIKNDPLYVINIISHELLEVILCAMGARYESIRANGNYLFNFDHQTFENAVQLHTMLLTKFTK